jgi:hypothetical protein
MTTVAAKGAEIKLLIARSMSLFDGGSADCDFAEETRAASKLDTHTANVSLHQAVHLGPGGQSDHLRDRGGSKWPGRPGLESPTTVLAHFDAETHPLFKRSRFLQPFPPKKAFGNEMPAFVSGRSETLQKYLTNLLRVAGVMSTATFLGTFDIDPELVHER